MQPTYLPWPGYFNLISNVDKFVFLDDVQFEKQSWQTRNRVLFQGRECLLSVPVRKCSLDTPIYNVIINNGTGWSRKHWRTLRQAYSRATYGREALTVLEELFTGEPPISISEFNQAVILRIAAALSLSPVFYRASDLKCGGARSEHLAQICQRINCSEYISPRGAAAYLEADNFENVFNVRLIFQSFDPQPYQQFRSNEFVSHLSIVDVIANIGIEQTKTYIS